MHFYAILDGSSKQNYLTIEAQKYMQDMVRTINDAETQLLDRSLTIKRLGIIDKSKRDFLKFVETKMRKSQGSGQGEGDASSALRRIDVEHALDNIGKEVKALANKRVLLQIVYKQCQALPGDIGE